MYPSLVDYIVSLTPGAAEDPFEAAATPPDGASVVEVRADLFPGIDISALVSSCPLPVLVTVRSTAEGGQGPDDAGQREASLREAHESGAAQVDFEFARDLPLMSSLGIDPERVILSWHDAEETPADLEQIADAMLETTARTVKVVPTAKRLADVSRVLGMYGDSRDRRRRLLAFAMGAIGLPTRYLAPILGSPVAFVAWNDRAPAAPGQTTLGQIRDAVSHLHGPPQILYGVIGSNVGSSLSPLLHAAAYREESMPCLLVPVNVADENELELLFQPSGSTLFDRIGLTTGGWAVTSPYKRAAARSADILAPRAQRADAANTLILKPTQVIAENTDADGVVGSLTGHGIEPCDRLAVVQGTGGAARGAAVGLDLAGASVILRGRDAVRTQKVAEAIDVAWCEPDTIPDGSELLVNATPLGGRPDDQMPFSLDEIEKAVAVVDMVYADRPTPLAVVAIDSAVELIDGREMLAYQGFAQFAAFTGRIPPKAAMFEALGVKPKR